MKIKVWLTGGSQVASCLLHFVELLKTKKRWVGTYKGANMDGIVKMKLEVLLHHCTETDEQNKAAL